MFTDISVWMVLLYGVASFLSPCVLPMVPAYIGMLSGQFPGDSGFSRRAAILGTLFFIAGFTIVFALLGAAASAAGQLLLAYQRPLRVAFGIIIAFFGLFQTGAINPRILNAEKRKMKLLSGVSPYLVALTMGAGFAFGWTPCVGPALTAALMLAARGATLFRGVLYLTVFSLGIGLPFLLLSIFIGSLTPLLGRLKRHMGRIKIASGILLIVVGLLMATGLLDRLSGLG